MKMMIIKWMLSEQQIIDGEEDGSIRRKMLQKPTRLRLKQIPKNLKGKRAPHRKKKLPRKLYIRFWTVFIFFLE